jgi:Fe2+ or Zn2+ uptake regulation protein
MSKSRPPAGPTTELHATVEARLRAVHHSYTAKRQAIVEVLGCADQPLSIPEMLVRDPRLVQSSVYRNLGVLESAGVVQRIVTTDEFARFEVAEALSGHHHHHLICSSCGSVEDITLPPAVETSVSRELDKLAKQRGFTPSDHQIDLVGLCASCR